jgi:peptidoglycan L-alanyl-D-glutamate endopeptidase CwlK
MASRDINDLVPELQVKYRRFASAMADACVPFIVTCTVRSDAEQYALWMQGRFPLIDVNDHRRVVGLPPITKDENRRKITWTIHSKHSSGRAFDIAVARDGKPTWDLKADVDLDGVPDYAEAGHIAEECGLRWGGEYKDFCHFELKG